MFVAENRLLGGLGEENMVRNRDTDLRLIETSQKSGYIYLYDSVRTTGEHYTKLKTKAPQPKDCASQYDVQGI